jgi:hypothetical protein
MKKKYYFRGLGVGILVTAILFSIGLIFYKPTLSDEEIKKKALALGMTESTENSSKNGPIPPAASGALDSGADTASGAQNSSGTENSDGSVTTKTELTPDDVKKNIDTSNDSDSADAPSSDFGTITITGGQDSRVVVKNLHDAGIIDDESDFNEYLESNNYDRYIRNGSYNIKKGASYDEIVHTITSK